MKKYILAILSLVAFGTYAQDMNRITNEEIKFLYIKVSSSKSTIYYGDGFSEEVDHMSQSEAKTLDIEDREESSSAILVDKILSNGWKLVEVSLKGSQMDSRPGFFYFSR